MVTWRSLIWEVWEEMIRRYRRMVPGVHVSNNKIKNLVTIGVVVNKLAQLRREAEKLIRLVAVEVTQEEKPSLWKFHFHQVIVHG